MPRPAQPWLIRVTHWANVVLLAVMAGSGLRILIAYPSLGEQGQAYAWYPFQGVAAARRWSPSAGGWRARATGTSPSPGSSSRTGSSTSCTSFASGEWKRRLFCPRRDARNAWQTVLARPPPAPRAAPPPVGLYNGMQRLAYTAVLRLGLLARALGPGALQAGAAAAPDRAPRRLRRGARPPPAGARGAGAVHGRPRRPGAAAPAHARRHDRGPGRRPEGRREASDEHAARRVGRCHAGPTRGASSTGPLGGLVAPEGGLRQRRPPRDSSGSWSASTSASSAHSSIRSGSPPSCPEEATPPEPSRRTRSRGRSRSRLRAGRSRWAAWSRAPLTLTLADLQRLPRTRTASATTAWRAGARSPPGTACRLAEMARHVGVDPRARYVEFRSFDAGLLVVVGPRERAAPADDPRLRHERRAAAASSTARRCGSTRR